MSLKIGIDIRSLMSSSYAGVGEYTYHMIRNMIEADSVNQYFLFYNSYNEVNVPFEEKENVRLVGYRFPNKFLNFGFKFFKYPEIKHLFPEKMDVFFLPNLNFIAFGEGVYKILTVHDLSFKLSSSFYSKKRIFWHQAVDPGALFSEVDKIIAISENTRNDLINYYQVPDEKIEVIYSGVSEEYTKIKDSEYLYEIKKKYQLPQNFILFLGTIEPRKNIISLIEAYELLVRHDKKKGGDDLHLVIAGGKGWEYQEVFRKINASRLKKRIHYIGYIDKQDKPSLYNLAKVFVYPSFYEGFGFPVLEAYLCHTPVVLSHHSSLIEVLGNGGVFVNPHNVLSISQGIKEAMDVSVCNDIIKQLRKDFSWEKAANQFLKVLHSSVK